MKFCLSGSQGQKRMLTKISTKDEVETKIKKIKIWLKQTVVLHCVCSARVFVFPWQGVKENDDHKMF